jgi:hypothetical protein
MFLTVLMYAWSIVVLFDGPSVYGTTLSQVIHQKNSCRDRESLAFLHLLHDHDNRLTILFTISHTQKADIQGFR